MTAETIQSLHAGEALLLTGYLYTARDSAHKKLVAMIHSGEPLPIELDGATIYYAGPCPAKPGEVIGSIGPTTSGRMDRYAPLLMPPRASWDDREGRPQRGSQRYHDRNRKRLPGRHRRRRRIDRRVRPVRRGCSFPGTWHRGDPPALGGGLPGPGAD